jgi:hypothetical protein
MLKPTTFFMRSWYPYKKQIKTDYEFQFPTDLVLDNEIEKKNQLKIRHKKQLKYTRINLLNTIPESRNRNNIIESKQNKSWNLILNQYNIKW